MKARYTKIVLGLLVAIVVAISATPAQANSITLTLTANPIPTGANWTYIFSVGVGAGDRLQVGSYFTVIDVGPIGGACALCTTSFTGVGWGAPTQALVGTINSQPVIDNPTVLNLSYAYTGGVVDFGPSTEIGTLTIVSSIFQPDPTWDARDFKSLNGSIDDSYHQGSQVPEPTSMVLLGVGVLGLAGFARKRK